MARWQIVVRKSEAIKHTKDQNKNKTKNKDNNETKNKTKTQFVVVVVVLIQGHYFPLADKITYQLHLFHKVYAFEDWGTRARACV